MVNIRIWRVKLKLFSTPVNLKKSEFLKYKNMKKFKKLVEKYRDDIVRKWVDFFVYNIEINSEKITERI